MKSTLFDKYGDIKYKKKKKIVKNQTVDKNADSNLKVKINFNMYTYYKTRRRLR